MIMMIKKKAIFLFCLKSPSNSSLAKASKTWSMKLSNCKEYLWFLHWAKQFLEVKQRRVLRSSPQWNASFHTAYKPNDSRAKRGILSNEDSLLFPYHEENSYFKNGRSSIITLWPSLSWTFLMSLSPSKDSFSTKTTRNSPKSRFSFFWFALSRAWLFRPQCTCSLEWMKQSRQCWWD